MSKKDIAKDALGTAGGVVAAVTTGALLGPTALAALPALAVNTVFNVCEVLRRRRIEKWWEYVSQGNSSTEDDEKFVARLNNGLLNDDESVVLGIVGGARAATDAVDPAAIVSIARLTKMYFSGEIALWVYRAALEVLSSLTAAELGALRDLTTSLVKMEKFSRDLPRLMAQPFIDEEFSDVSWETSELEDPPLDDDNPYKRRDVVKIKHAPRVFQVLRRSTLGEDAPSGGFGSMSARNILVLPLSNARLLARVLSIS